MGMRLLVVLLLTGCATKPAPQYVWLHDSGVSNQAQHQRDFGQCEAQVLGSHPLTSNERGMQMMLACMQGRGWRLVQR